MSASSVRRRLVVAVLPALAGLAVVAVAAPGRAAFPGANGRLLFLTGPEARPRLCVVHPRGGALMAIPIRRGVLNSAAWSPRGTRIAYSRTDTFAEGRIVVSSASGRASRTVLAGADFFDVAWSPDGRSIAYVEWWSARGPETAIGVVRSGARPGQEPRYVVGMDFDRDDIGEYRSPAWSPDGRRIAFDFWRPGEARHDIYTVDVRGGTPRRLTTDPAFDFDPTWSPDGRRIAFTSQRDGRFRIYVMNADGSNPLALTRGGDDGDPAWSPDGRSVAFVRVVGGRASIHTVSVATGRERLVARPPGGAFGLDWQPAARGTTAARPRLPRCR